MNLVRKIWILPSQVHSNILIIMVVSLTMISVCSIRIICRELTYQLFLNGHPTFNDQQLNEINVTWGEKGIYDYKRALLRSSVPLDGATTSLDSLETVRASLANNHNIDFEKVSNMIVGYKEDDQPDKDDIEVQRNSEFIPTWYVEYDGEWYVYRWEA